MSRFPTGCLSSSQIRGFGTLAHFRDDTFRVRFLLRYVEAKIFIELVTISTRDLADHDSDSTEVAEQSNPGVFDVHAARVTQRTISSSSVNIRCKEKGCRTRAVFQNESDFK